MKTTKITSIKGQWDAQEQQANFDIDNLPDHGDALTAEAELPREPRRYTVRPKLAEAALPVKRARVTIPNDVLSRVCVFVDNEKYKVYGYSPVKEALGQPRADLETDYVIKRWAKALRAQVPGLTVHYSLDGAALQLGFTGYKHFVNCVGITTGCTLAELREDIRAERAEDDRQDYQIMNCLRYEEGNEGTPCFCKVCGGA